MNTNNLKYQMIIQWSDEDEAYLVSLPEFPHQKWHTHGDTYEETVARTQSASSAMPLGRAFAQSAAKAASKALLCASDA